MDLSDYVWKSVRLLDHETKLELKKLNMYHSDDPVSASLRWKLESQKLRVFFPHLIATGNLYNVTSLFEAYLLRVSRILQEELLVSLDSVKGQGVAKIWNHLKQCSISFGSLPLYEQVQATIKVRNCLVHTGGMLAWSRDLEVLKQIQTTGAYLSPEHRQRTKDRGDSFDDIIVRDDGFGERLQVTNAYPHLLASYLREYFLDLCLAADDVLARR